MRLRKPPAAEPAPPALRKPVVIAGYEVLDELGRGPLGKVYRARHEESGRMVVFRGFTRPADADESRWNQAVERFREVLEAHKKVHGHRNIQDILDYGEENGLFWIASEYFEGRTLREIVDQEGPRTLTWALGTFRQLAAAIDYAAVNGLCHTDLTPHNVLVIGDSDVRVINYGLGRTRDKTGSPYAAPEQTAGFEGDLQSDIYALGALLYEVLSGHPPYSGSQEEVAAKVRSSLPAPLLNQPPFVRDVIAKMMARAPEKRYRVAMDAVEDLAQLRSPLDSPLRASGQEQAAADADIFDRFRGERLPSLADYSLSGQDLLDIHFRRAQRLEAERYRKSQIRRRIAWSAAVAGLIALLGHAWNRPSRYTYAVVKEIKGTPKLVDGKDSRPLKLGERLHTPTVRSIQTDGQSTVLLEMADSRVKVGKYTQLELNRLGYQGGSIRSFSLKQGRIWAHVAPLRRDSRFEVRCRGVRVTVKGTDFGVKAMESGALVTASAGQVRVDTGSAQKVLNSGNQIQAMADQALGEPAKISAEEQALIEANREVAAVLEGGFGDILGSLEEATLVPILEAAASIAKLSPGDAARVFDDAKALAKAQTALQAICTTLLTSGEDSVPPALTLHTLQELPVKQEDRRMWLDCFENGRLLKYQVSGPDEYEILARAADSRHTLLRARNGKVSVVKE